MILVMKCKSTTEFRLQAVAGAERWVARLQIANEAVGFAVGIDQLLASVFYARKEDWYPSLKASIKCLGMWHNRHQGKYFLGGSTMRTPADDSRL